MKEAGTEENKMEAYYLFLIIFFLIGTQLYYTVRYLRLLEKKMYFESQKIRHERIEDSLFWKTHYSKLLKLLVKNYGDQQITTKCPHCKMTVVSTIYYIDPSKPFIICECCHYWKEIEGGEGITIEDEDPIS